MCLFSVTFLAILSFGTIYRRRGLRSWQTAGGGGRPRPTQKGGPLRGDTAGGSGEGGLSVLGGWGGRASRTKGFGTLSHRQRESPKEHVWEG